MKTVSTKIKDFSIGDTFIFHESIFEVTGELNEWTGHSCRTDTRKTYGRSCKFIRRINGKNQNTPFGSLLTTYDWMQGIEEVTYGKII